MSFTLNEVTEENLNLAISFIEGNNEENSVALMSRLIDGSWKSSVYYYYIVSKIDENQSEIIAVLMHSKGGLVQHSIKNPSILFSDEEFHQSLFPFFEGRNLYCIMGEHNGTKLLEEIASKVLPEKQISEQREYLLLLYHPENLPDELIDRKFDFNIVKCGPLDLRKLTELQKMYDIVEVQPKGKAFSEELSRKNLELMLKKQMIYAVKVRGKYVAKAGTNAIGKNFMQIGGVYTDEKFRGNGMAQALVTKVSKEILACGKQCALFVRVLNTSAKAAYRKVGYTYQSDYIITYYREDLE